MMPQRMGDKQLQWVIFDKKDVHIQDMIPVQIREAKGITLRGELLNQAEAA